MKEIKKDEAIKLIESIFPAMTINHIRNYEYIFITPENPVITRNTGRLIFKDKDMEISLDIYDNSPSSWSFFKLKIKINGELILLQTGEYDNISYSVGIKETDFLIEEKLRKLFFYEYDLITL